MRELDIGDLSQRSGLPVWTLRFYGEKGLIASIGWRFRGCGHFSDHPTTLDECSLEPDAGSRASNTPVRIILLE
jgi:hypothetical protein